MVTLFCAIVGVAGSAFPVDIDEGESVGDLKNAIKAKKPTDFKDIDANRLQLFLAKTDGGTWLRDDDQAALDLEDGKVHEGIQALIDGEKMKATKTLQHWLFEKNKMPQPSTDQIHVLVEVPEQDVFRSPGTALLEVILPHVLTGAPTTWTELKRNFKDKLCKFYGCYRREKTWVRCMLLNVAFPKSLVIAAHLFRRSNEYLSLMMMQISDIDDMKNGMLLFKPLEYAFDHFQISFIRDDTDTFRLKLFDVDIRDTRLVDIEDRKGKKVLDEAQIGELLESVSLTEEPCQFDVKTTFGDVDGSTLTFTGLERPFCRCLYLQARLARMVALKKGWVDASYDFSDFWSEVSLDDKMDLFHRSIMDAELI